MLRAKEKQAIKLEFKEKLTAFVKTLDSHISSSDRQWTVKGFIDIYKSIFTISSDTKILSKILEIHLFPKILQFAETNDLKIVLAEHQNYYPDISFVSSRDESIKFALDLKTTYRLPDNPEFYNGFTLGSHGQYFVDRSSRKNIQFPYSQYLGHFCLGIIYTRCARSDIQETRVHKLSELTSIVSVIKDFQFFVREKWEIASDSRGSWNTANIGSVFKISDILGGNGVFKNLGEKWFDEYWMNYGKITLPRAGNKKITRLKDFLIYRGKDPSLAVPVARPRKA